jgi:hypothetical protein
MSDISHSNAFRVLSRSLGSPLGAFHRSNAALLVAALLIHCASLVAVWVGTDEVLGLALVGGLLMVGLIGTVAALGTIRHQTKAAFQRGGWDELLVTPLTDREIINGQLILALRPYFAIIWLTIASPVVLIFLLSWSALDNMNLDDAVATIVVSIAIALGMLIAMGLMIYIVCVGSLLRAFTGRRHLGQLLVGGIRSLFLLTVIALLTIFVFPLAWVIVVAFAWLQHRTLCCSLRARLLADR